MGPECGPRSCVLPILSSWSRIKDHSVILLSCKPCHLVISPHLANSTSEATHALVATLATCRVKVAGVTRGRKGHMRSEEGERSLAIAGLRRRLGVLTVRCQAMSLLGRLEVLGPGATAAAGRRWQAAELESCWRREERAHTLASAQGWSAYRTGFGKLDWKEKEERNTN